ncbi:hypothetical protein Asp14428_33570 [Actinoplanes sp. NBRC 14428]|nr:hypothetical protein Asp14428_33570 [Actinoplanes sp. NBRC 14428]
MAVHRADDISVGGFAGEYGVGQLERAGQGHRVAPQNEPFDPPRRSVSARLVGTARVEPALEGGFLGRPVADRLREPAPGLRDRGPPSSGEPLFEIVDEVLEPVQRYLGEVDHVVDHVPVPEKQLILLLLGEPGGLRVAQREGSTEGRETLGPTTGMDIQGGEVEQSGRGDLRHGVRVTLPGDLLEQFLADRCVLDLVSFGEQAPQMIHATILWGGWRRGVRPRAPNPQG